MWRTHENPLSVVGELKFSMGGGRSSGNVPRPSLSRTQDQESEVKEKCLSQGQVTDWTSSDLVSKKMMLS